MFGKPLARFPELQTSAMENASVEHSEGGEGFLMNL